ncbi:LOW QUALITY PROTEIN: uncharacterized protein LOC100178086 [Ciona intestinalis]
MAYKGQKVQKVMVQPINLIFRYLQNRSRVSIWVYEQVNMRIEGHIVGFDEYMNLVLDDAEEVNIKKNVRKTLGRVMLKGDNITMELHPILEHGETPSGRLWYVVSSPDPPCARVGQAAVFCKHTMECIIIGGADPSTTHKDVHRLQMSDFSWHSHGPLEALERYEHCCFQPTCSNDIYIFGGASKQSNTNTMLKVTSDMTCTLVGCKGVSPTPRTLHCAGSKGNSLYIWGGGYEGSSPTPDTQLHVFDANNATWSQPMVKGKLPSARHGHIMCVIGNQLYIHGGMAGATFHKDLHSINLTDMMCNKLKPRGEVPCARAAHAAASHNKLLFIFGGMSQHGALDDLSSLNTDTMIWTKITFDSPMPTPRLDHSMFVAQIVCNKDVPNVTPSTPHPTYHTVATSGQNIIPVDLWRGVITHNNDGVITHSDGVVTHGNDGVVTHGNDGVVTHGNDGVVTHGNDGVITHGNDGVVTHGNDGVVTHGNDGVVTHGNDGVITHGNDGVITHGNDGVVTHGNDGVVTHGNDGVVQIGERLARELTLVESDTIPALVIFGGMDTSGNLYNDVLLTRLDDLT